MHLDVIDLLLKNQMKLLYMQAKARTIPASGIGDTSQYRAVSYSPHTVPGMGPDTRLCDESTRRLSQSCWSEVEPEQAMI